jgi:hypothetical protein
VAYHGRYAARPGILSDPDTATDLTISLENEIDNAAAGGGGFQGGLLTFAVHASVQMPIDALYFSINGEVIRSFEEVTGDAGDWEEVSTLLLPGEHTLTWSYQFFGMPEEEDIDIDPRRVGNSWIDAIALTPYTGSHHFQDNDQSGLLSTDTGMASWNLVTDAHAFMGSKSYVAYTDDISSNQGAAEMSWTVIVGPHGGVISFAAFASIYAPHDVLEFNVDNVPEVAITVPSYSWEQKYVALTPGRHVLTWRLVKNTPGLSQSTLNGVNVPTEYQGYAKIDEIAFTDNSGGSYADLEETVADTSTSTTSTDATTTSTADLTTTTTTSSTTTTTTTSTEESSTTTNTVTSSSSTTTTTESPVITTTTANSDEDDSSTSSTVVVSGSTEENVSGTTTTATILTTTTSDEAEDDDQGDEDVFSSTTTTTTAATGDVDEITATSEGTDDNDEDDEGSTTTTEAPELTEGEDDQEENEQDQVDEEEGDIIEGCPDGLQAVEGLPGCCVEEPDFLGDGACDPNEPYNTAACAFDLGDCCHETCNEDGFYGCKTKEGNGEGENGDDIGPFGFFCVDPRSSIIDPEKCQVENRQWIGDGGCDMEGGYNTEECGWDGGDCCEETCDDEFSFYTCGAVGYSCSNPNIGKERRVSFSFSEGFESGEFSSEWTFMNGDASWEVDDDRPAADGTHFAEARTEDIIDDVGEAVLELIINSPKGGKLSYWVQTFIQAPHEDLVLKIDDEEVNVIIDSVPEWTKEENVVIPAGRVSVKWVHRKNPANESADTLEAVEPAEGISRIDGVYFDAN